MIKKALFKLKQGTEEYNYGRKNIVDFAEQYTENIKNPVVVDLGAGYGTDLLNVKKSLGRGTYVAVEEHAPYRKMLKAEGITSHAVNIETDKLPFEDNSVDVIIANQIIEHVKEIFWIFHEIHRVLKPGGVIIVGVPNIASLHSRIGLLFGAQPTAIEMYSAHVRGITYKNFKNLLEVDGFFKVRGVKGANFYPFPRQVSRWLEKAFPTMSVGITVVAQKTKKGMFISILEKQNFETPYYRGQ
jgi:SAM-dependent methyltransferase